MIWKKLFQGDKTLWVIFFFLVVISLVEVYSASSTLAYQGRMMTPILKHTAFVILSIGTIIVVSRFNAVTLKYMGGGLYFISLGLLIIAAFSGTSINGASRWIPLPFGLTFQPSEVMKIALVMVAAFVYTLLGHVSAKKRFAWFLVLTAVPLLIIAKDNLSTAILIAVFFFFISWIGSAPSKYLFWLCVVGLGTALLAYLLLLTLPGETLSKISNRAPTWKNRIVSDPALKEMTPAQRDSMMYVITDDNFQESHAKIAIARGGLFGVLPGNSIERDILPQAFSDYIYAIIIEEMGFIFGGVLIPLAYFILFFRLAQLAQRVNSRYEGMLLMGFGLLYLLQAMFNFIVASGIIVTGQTLPLISKGGTSYLITSLAFGILMSISRRISQENEKDADEPMIIEAEATELNEQEPNIEGV
ncbi:FtsW/RodA/SpoVE family cell cycle protein [Porphyromonas loveana]|uniref:Probable peptidoglycan glycosyltransferase FtsW n=2 Tax=Porphyromonas loveana TaxID=1884669 RepID=A0A2U1FHK2_9PORP|nr:FtsW/RodA/SpoVE family cell cycle protein [Porphyromonas loveana]PVZ11639.1 cell division protein FtsW [Porphyromonas loveana]